MDSNNPIHSGWLLLLLFVLAPFFAEAVASSNTPFISFVNPLVFISLALLYGSSAILLREILVRKSYSTLHMLLFGAAFAILNEGVVAASWFRTKVNGYTFASLTRAGGVNWHLVVGLVIFHSLFSLLLPILLVNSSFSLGAYKPLLKTRGYIFFTVLLCIPLFGSLVPSAKTGHHLPAYFAYRVTVLLIALAIIGLGLILPAKNLALRRIEKLSNKIFWAGFLFSLVYWALLFLLARSYPLISTLLLLALYIGFAVLIKPVLEQVQNSPGRLILLTAGLILLPAAASLLKTSELQPLAILIFGCYLIFLHIKTKRQTQIV